jgi:hypothetical protein
MFQSEYRRQIVVSYHSTQAIHRGRGAPQAAPYEGEYVFMTRTVSYSVIPTKVGIQKHHGAEFKTYFDPSFWAPF